MFLVLGVLAACQSPSDDSSTPPSPVHPSSPVVVDRKIDVGASREIRTVQRRAELAFKASNGGFRAGYQTHAVQINGGEIEMRVKQGEQTGSAIKFATREISRNGTPIASPVKTTRALASDVLIDRGAVIEQVENRENGVEQSWKFGSAPRGNGDLVVGVSVSGHQSVATSQHGLHFFAGKLGFRYSHARWLDAGGGAWDLPAQWENGRIVIRVPEQILTATQYPAVLDPTLEPESGVDDLVFGNAGAGAISPSIATRIGGFLAVWADGRVDSRNPDIYATRVTSGGAVMDLKGIVVNNAAGVQNTPVVARTDTAYIVAWRTAQDIAAASVDDVNTVTQLGTVAGTAADDSLPAIAASGSTAVLAWQSGSSVMASAYNGSFGTPITIAATGSEPAVAASGTGYLVIWTDSTGVQGQLLTSAGALSGVPFTIAMSGGAFNAAATFNGTDFVTVFNMGADIYGARVSSAGALVDLMPVALVTSAGPQQESSVACDGASCLVMYSDTRNIATSGFDIYAQRVNHDLTANGGEITVQTAGRYQVTPTVATNAGGGWMSIWEDQRTGGPSLAIGTVVSGGGAVADAVGTVISTSYAQEQDPATASGGGQQIVVWSDSRSLGNDILGLRFAGVAGSGLDNPPKVISNAANEQAAPATTWDGTNFMTVWSDARGADRDIYAARTDTNGTVLDASGIAVSTATRDQLLPDVASGGGVSLAVWMDRRNGDFDIYGAIINSAGAVSVADIQIAGGAADQDAPTVVYDPGNGVFIVAWSDKNTATVADIRGTRVSTAGAVLDAGGVAISASTAAQLLPDLAVSGGIVMCVWDDRRSDPTGDIIGSRVSAANNALASLDPGGIPISYTQAGRQNSPTVVGLPTDRFVVAWSDQRNVATNGSDIFGVELNNQGQPTDTVGFAIASGPGHEGGAAFQVDPNDSTRVAIVYHGYRADLDTTRVFRRLINFESQLANNGAVCAYDSQCSSGFCVDSRCCDSACGGSGNHNDCQTCSTVFGGSVDGMCTVVTTESICRNFGTFECDLREYCDGVNASCPADIGRNQGLACTTPAGAAGTCPSDAAPGPHVCQ